MQVCAGDSSACANRADSHAAQNLLTIFHLDLIEMAEQGHKTLTVIDYDGIAVEVEIAGCGNNPCSGGDDRRAERRCNIHAFVW